MENNDADSIADYIKNAIMIGKKPHVKIKDESFIYEILKDRGDWKLMRTAVKKGWRFFHNNPSVCTLTMYICHVRRTLLKSVKINFVRVFATLVFCLTALTIGIVFFINGVLFFKNYNEIYKEGTIVTKQSLNREHMMFLFSASDLWANTGIKVMKGDLIKISASGAFNSSISNIIDSTKNNTTPYRKWTNILDTRNGDNLSKELTIYKGNDSRFGALLMQIQPEVNSCIYDQEPPGKSSFFLNSNQQIWQITEDMVDRYFYVNTTGNVYFAINDIYLSNSIIERYCTDSLEGRHKDLFFIDATGKKIIANGTPGSPEDPIHMALHKHFSRNRACWFDDNIGEVLVCMNIARRKNGFIGTLHYIYAWSTYHPLYFTGSLLLVLFLIIFVKIKLIKKERLSKDRSANQT